MIAARSGGEFKLQWPQVQDEVIVAAKSRIEKQDAENTATEVVIGTEEKMPQLIAQSMDTAAMKATVRCAVSCLLSSNINISVSVEAGLKTRASCLYCFNCGNIGRIGRNEDG